MDRQAKKISFDSLPGRFMETQSHRCRRGGSGAVRACQERTGNERRAVVVLSRASWRQMSVHLSCPGRPGTFWNVCFHAPTVSCPYGTMAIEGFVASAGSRLVHCLTTHETEQDTGNSAVTGACIWLLQEQTSRSTFIMHASCQPGGRSPRQPVRLAGLHAQMSTPLQFPASGSPAAAIEGLPGQPRRE